MSVMILCKKAHETSVSGKMSLLAVLVKPALGD